MVPSCPDAASLQCLLDDTLPETVQAELSQHLESCASCRAALDKLATEGRSLIGLARDLHQNPTPAEPGLQRVLNEAAGAVPGETQAEPCADKNEDLAFLAPSSKPGTLGRLGHYEVHEIIGRGAFGIVLKAFDEQLHRVVAVKVLAPHIASSGTARKRFTREAQAAAAIAHEHVVTIHAVEDGHNPPYLVMHFIAGMSLQEKLDQEGPLGLKAILRIGLQTAEGLAAAHKQGLVHRDIKPANILLENGVERVRITDFGLARAMDDASLTQSGVIAGTPMYMSPEQAEGQSIDHRSDLFSLGTVLYVMCTGRPPFRAANTMAVLKRVCEETPRPIREINPEMPDWLSDIVAKLHAKKPEERYQTAKEVAELLGEKLAELQFTGRANFGRAEGSKPLGDAAQATMAAPALFAPATGSPTSRRLVFAGVLLALAASVFAAVVYWPRDGVVLQPEQKPPVIGVVDKPPPLAVAPFDAAKAKEHQDAWAKYLGVESEITNSIGMKLRLIPPGEFMAGTAADDTENLVKRMAAQGMSLESIANVRRETPPVQASVKQPFYLGACEVTMGQFRTFVEATKYQTDGEKSKNGGWSNRPGGEWLRHPDHIWKTPGPWKSEENHPVVHVSWNDARAFCKWLSDKEGVAYTLPEGQQWEFAARAGTTALYGDVGNSPDSLFEIAWTRDTQGQQGPHPVGSRRPNAFGLYDMLGNAYEWCLDPYPGAPGFRVVRGGSWYSPSVEVRPALTPRMREGLAPDAGTGFRVALVGDLKSKPAADQWVQLFNGKDLTGWTDLTGWKLTPTKPVRWKVENGILVGRADGYDELVSERGDYANFHLHVEARIDAAGDSGVYIRHQLEPRKVGIEAQIGCGENAWDHTGALGRPKQPARKMLTKPDEWFTMEIIARGNRIIVKVNDEVTADGVDPDSTVAKGFIALQLLRQTVVQFRKIEIKELPPTKNADLAPPFVILGKDAGPERKFVTLAEAAATAQAGDSIEIRGDGPFVTEPIKITRKALTIRAGDGYRPHLRLRPEVIDQPLLSTDAAFVLEGLTLEATGKRKEGYPQGVIFSLNASLHIAHCRFLGPDRNSWAAVRAQGMPACSMQNCILGSVNVGIDFNHIPRKARYVLDNNVIQGGGVAVNQTTTDVEDVSIRLRNNTFLSDAPIQLGFIPPLNKIVEERPNPNVTGLRLEASGNILDSSWYVCFFAPYENSLSLEKAVPLLPRLVSFQDDDNLYSITTQPFLSVNRNEEPKPLRAFKTLAEWHKFWGIAKSTSQIGLAQFQGGDLRAKDSTSPGELAPADFRLAKGSPGQGAGPGGKDLGADVDLVGPGPAYEKWKQTEGYQQWLKDSGQVKAVEPASDLEKLQGTWVITSFAVGGKAVPGPVGDTFTIEGDTFTLSPRTELMKGTVKVDPNQKPKAIDLDVTEGGKKGVALCIYALEAGELKLSFAEPGVKARPTELGSKEGTTHIFATLKRKKN